MKKEEYVLNNKCPSCGSSINFNPLTGGWFCTFCRKDFSLEEMMKHDNASSKKNNENTAHENCVVYKCESCGAEIVTDENTAATFCVYCRNTAILKNKLTGEFRPKMIIPFKKTKEDAIKAFKEVLKGKPLAPRDFNSQDNIDKIRGVYIPFWLYDIIVDGDMSGNCTKVKSWISGDYSYTQTDVYNVERVGNVRLKKIPVDGSTHFDNALMNSIEPFDYNDLIDYNHAYLAGFLAEKYDVNDIDASSDAIERSNETLKQEFNNSIKGYSSKIITNEKICSQKEDDMYVMMPVYMLNIKFKGNMYTFAMNGQTGKFIGNVPIDKKRAWLFRISIFLGTAIVIFIISIIVYWVGML